MITLDPLNGAHVYPTRLAIDRHVITDEQTEKTTVLWRLLEFSHYTRRYSIVCMSTSSAEIACALACYHISSARHFEDIDEITPAFDELIKLSKSAIAGIIQNAVLEQGKHG